MPPIPKLFTDWDVLVVDDEPDSLEVATRMLKLAGANVYTADNGRDGLEAAKEKRPRFILSDISMPVMDGWQMIAQLKRNPATNAIPVIALTAHTMPGDREKAMAAGFHNHISKPLDPPKLVQQLANILMDIPDIAALIGKN